MGNQLLNDKEKKEYLYAVIKIIEIAKKNGYKYTIKTEENQKTEVLITKYQDEKIKEHYIIPIKIKYKSDVGYYEFVREKISQAIKRKEENDIVETIKEKIDIAKRKAEGEIVKSLSEKEFELYFTKIK